MSKSSSSSSGIGFCGLLTILFVALKLLRQIDWSWWWVLSPLWLPLVTFLGIMGACIITYLITEAIKELNK